MPNRAAIRAVVCAAALVVLSSVAPAQQAYDQWTLEAMAAQARVVLRGTISDILSLDAESKPNAPPRVTLMLTIRVEERLKGKSDRWMTLTRDTLASDGRYELWKKAKTPLLWFVFSQEDPRPFPGSQIGPGLDLPPGQSWTAIRLSPPEPGETTFDPYAGQGVFSMDFSVVKDGKDIVDVTRRYIKGNPYPAKVCRILVPASVTSAIGYTGGIEHLIVPVTPDLQTLALKMINSPEAFLPKGRPATETAWIRASGVKALANFNSAQNVSLLKPLLNDPGKGPFDTMESHDKTYYWVRLAAYDVLTGWGVKTSKPILRD